MMETEVDLGSFKEDKEGTVVCDLPPAEMAGVVGLMGVTGRSW